MSNIDKQALREAATVATQGGWYVDYGFDVCHESGAFLAETHGDNLVQNAKFIAVANPSTVLELLDELEKAQRQIVNFQQSCENDPRIHEIIDLKELIAELDKRLIEYAGIATREARRVAELEKYRTAFMEWHDKTAWVQNDKRFDVVHPLGKHRADILGEYIKHLEREKDAIEAVALALRDDMRATRTLTVKMPTTKYQWGGGVLNTIDPVDMLEALRKSCAAIGIKLQITE